MGRRRPARRDPAAALPVRLPEIFPDGRLTAAVGGDRLRLWDTVTLWPAAPDYRSVPGNRIGVEFSPDGRLLATVEASTAQVWRLPKSAA
jgi:WD40 repeat protein